MAILPTPRFAYIACCMSEMPTLADVARQASVHISTASRALNDHRLIPKETRDRVKLAASLLGYRPNPIMTVLMESRRLSRPLPLQANLGFLISEKKSQARSWIKEVLSGAESYASSQGYSLQPFWAEEISGQSRTLARIIRSRNIQGLILSPEHEAPLQLELDWSSFAVISLHYGPSQYIPRFHQLVSNYFHSILEVCRHCGELGYRRIGLLLRDHPESHYEYGRLVYGAYFAGMTEEPFGQAIPPLVTRELDPARIAEWIREHQLDAIIQAGGGLSASDYPPAFYAAMSKHGIEIGSLTGLVVLGNHPGFNLAVVDERTESLGECAAKHLIDMFRRNLRGVPSDAMTYQFNGCFHPGSTLPSRLLAAPRPENALLLARSYL